VIPSAFRLPWRALQRFFDHHGPDRAAAVAYYTLLSLLPLLIFLISLGAALLGSFDAAYRGTLLFFRGVVVHLDPASREALRAFVERAVRFQWPGLLLLAWTAKRMFGSLFSALETVFETPARGFAHGNLLALAMVMFTGVAVIATLALKTFLAAAEGLLLRLAEATGVPGLDPQATQLLTQVVGVVVTTSFFFILYRVAPHRPVPRPAALAGALLATLLWQVADTGFAYYVRNLAHYAGVYGTLEGIIVLGLWLELSVSIILYAGEVVALLLPAPPSRSLPLTEAASGE
jgi:membrane protein